MSPPSLQLSCPCTNRLTHRMMTDRHTDRQDNLIVATLPNIINSIEMLNCQNRYNITWMLHQIFMYSDKLMLAAGYNNDTKYPLPFTPSPPLPSY